MVHEAEGERTLVQDTHEVMQKSTSAGRFHFIHEQDAGGVIASIKQ
jgi:hypothetical protein